MITFNNIKLRGRNCIKLIRKTKGDKERAMANTLKNSKEEDLLNVLGIKGVLMEKIKWSIMLK